MYVFQNARLGFPCGVLGITMSISSVELANQDNEVTFAEGLLISALIREKKQAIVEKDLKRKQKIWMLQESKKYKGCVMATRTFTGQTFKAVIADGPDSLPCTTLNGLTWHAKGTETMSQPHWTSSQGKGQEGGGTHL